MISGGDDENPGCNDFSSISAKNSFSVISFVLELVIGVETFWVEITVPSVLHVVQGLPSIETIQYAKYSDGEVDFPGGFQ